MKYYAIIVAGGSGSRMNSALPKQFILLHGKPVLMHTIEAFRASTYQPSILLVLHPDYQPYWQQLCEEYRFQTDHQVISGGAERFHSVKNALSTLEDQSVVAIHDAVRPAVSSKLIDSAYAASARYSAIVPAVESKDSIRQKLGDKTRIIPRSDILLVQTPQVFRTSMLKEAYAQPFNNNFTDDASVAEYHGEEIHIIPGETSNIKITYSEDLHVLSYILASRI